jgi:hypothetical protein
LLWCRVSELLRLFNVQFKILKSFDVSLCWFLKNPFVDVVAAAASFIGFQRKAYNGCCAILALSLLTRNQ